MNFLRLLAAHWVGVLWGTGLLLLVVVILQNVEPVRLDFLFWEFLEFPKLVLILGSMAIGGILAELGRLYLRRGRRGP